METLGRLSGIDGRDIEAVPNPTPQFRGWVWEMFFRGELDLIVTAVIQHRMAENPFSALCYLNEVSRQKMADDNVVVADLHSRRHRHWRIRDLKKVILDEDPLPREVRLLHGLIGHQAAVALLTGKLTAGSTRKKSSASTTAHQLSFLEEETGQPELPDELPIERSMREQELAGAFRHLSRAIPVLRELAFQPNSQRWPRNIGARLRRVSRALQTIYDGYYERLQHKAQILDRWTMLLTELSWAQLALRYRLWRRQRVFFREVAVLPTHQRFSGGRIDALEVRSIAGKSPNDFQTKILQQLAERSWGSTRELITELRRVFENKSLQLVVIDFKFLVGDIIQGETNRIPDVSTEPLAEHREQMWRYLSLIPLTYNYGRRHGRKKRNGGLWKTNHFSLKGEIWYLLADRAPLVHELHLNGSERERTFIERVVTNWRAVKRRASVRRTSNHVLGHLMRQITGTTTPDISLAPTNIWEQPQLFGASALGGTVLEFIGQQKPPRHFVDRYEIVERVGQNKTGAVLELRLDNYLRAVDGGHFPGLRFQPNQDMFIHCPMPDHREKTPSCRLYLRDNPPRFHCFGCGTRGRIPISSIPTESRQILSAAWSNPESRRRSLPRETILTIPDEHVRIMRLAQEELQRASRSSRHKPGFEYLWLERGLDLDAAREQGAGYWDTSIVIPTLLEAGYSLEQLIHYGFLGFSEKVRSNAELIINLRSHGLSLAQLRRQVGTSKSGTTLWGLPYATLDRRVTFPLSLYGQANNFYGRATRSCDKRFTHRKLPTTLTRIPQGGFNLQVLRDPQAQQVIVTEAAIDTLTLREMGYEHTLAMIGVDNAYIIEEIALAQKSIAIAFDTDDTGRKQTGKLMRRLKAAGLQQPVRDIMPQIQSQIPPGFKDPNAWWSSFIKERRADGSYLTFFGATQTAET